MLNDSPDGLSFLTHFLFRPFLENQRSINSTKCEVICHNVFCVNVAAFASNVVEWSTLWIYIYKIYIWMEPAYNRRSVKKQAVRVALASSIKRRRASYACDGFILYYLSDHFLKIKEVLTPPKAKLLAITYSASI